MADKVNGRTTGKSAGTLLRQAKRRNKSVFARTEIDYHVGRSANCAFQKIPDPVFSVQKFRHQLFVGKQEEDIAGLCSGQKDNSSGRWAATKRPDFDPRNKSDGGHSD